VIESGEWCAPLCSRIPDRSVMGLEGERQPQPSACWAAHLFYMVTLTPDSWTDQAVFASGGRVFSQEVSGGCYGMGLSQG
jgi:hypothetical protein